MRITESTFSTLQEEGTYERYDHLGLLDVPNESQISSMMRILERTGNLNLVTPNSFFCFGVAYRDVKVGSTYSTLFASQNVMNFANVEATLKYVNVNKSYEVDYLPRGYSGICLIEFNGSKPELLKKLKVYREIGNSEAYDTLYLSQKVVLDRIIRLSA